MNIKLSDYVAKKLYELGIRQVFMITGGGAMHLNQSLGSHDDLHVMFNHHEQASVIAAEAYARACGQPALVNVTTGPGGTNTITGIHGAWTDSIPLIVISGQVKTSTIASLQQPKLRQLGDQEVDICQIVSSITKYSVLITEPNTIRYHIEKAFYLATTGRPGPVWIDIPIDIQAKLINEDLLEGFEHASNTEDVIENDEFSDQIICEVKRSSRPVILLGTGVRISGMSDAIQTLIEKWKIPVVTGWNAHDIIPSDNPYFVGKPGTVGDRAGNFAVQNADLVLVLGCRLNIRQISYNWENFAKKAKVIMVDIDEQELEKPTLSIYKKIHADLKLLIPVLLKKEFPSAESHNRWLNWCKERQYKYPVVLENYKNSTAINPYYFIDQLFKLLPDDQTIVAANGSACVIGFQAATIKKSTRFWTNSGSASMGYDLPAAIGASLANEGKSVVCLAGDGSIMMNIQELATISGYKLPIKIFILNNQGYSSIYQTHRNFFNGREIGASDKSGVFLPNFERIAYGFDFHYFKLMSTQELENNIQNIIAHEGPYICEVILDDSQFFAPKLSSKVLEDKTIISPSLEDMFPFLTEAELDDNTWKQ
jgi:acetolactate synthase-1/2/3 large subunit